MPALSLTDLPAPTHTHTRSSLRSLSASLQLASKLALASGNRVVTRHAGPLMCVFPLLNACLSVSPCLSPCPRGSQKLKLVLLNVVIIPVQHPRIQHTYLSVSEPIQVVCRINM